MPARHMRVVGVMFWAVMAALHPQAVLAGDASLRRIKAAEIRKLFSGKEFSDDVHWAETYKANGTLEGAGMGRRFTKTWAVKNDMLCVAEKAAGPGGQAPQPTEEDCREVWAKGKKVELRRDAQDELAKEGVVR